MYDARSAGVALQLMCLLCHFAVENISENRNVRSKKRRKEQGGKKREKGRLEFREGLVPTLRRILFQMGRTLSVLSQVSSSETNAEVPPSPKGAPSSWELCLKRSGLQSWAGPAVDPVGTTAPWASLPGLQGDQCITLTALLPSLLL